MNFVAGVNGPTYRLQVSCSYAAEAHAGVVPKEVLMQLPVGELVLSTYHVVREVVTVNNTCVILSAAMANLASGGTESSLGEATILK